MGLAGLSTAAGHEAEVFDALKAALDDAGSAFIPEDVWRGMSLACRERWLEAELTRLKERDQGALTSGD